MSFASEIREVGTVEFPRYTSTRIMMMPFHVHDLESLPDELAPWRPVVATLRGDEYEAGVAYLTIDEADVAAGTTHRRPGLHVDGVGPDGGYGVWGGGGPWGARGMVVAASVAGCRGWVQDFDGVPGGDDCEHLRPQCRPDSEVVMAANRAYWCGPSAVHESIIHAETTRRQFVRLSMPSTAPWFDGYTANPMGVLPTGPVLPARTKHMAYRPA